MREHGPGQGADGLRRRTWNDDLQPVARAHRRIAAVKVTDRLIQGMHIRILTTQGGRRSAWVSHSSLTAARAGATELRDAVVPTDGGRPFGASSAEILGLLCRQDSADMGSLESEPIDPGEIELDEPILPGEADWPVDPRVLVVAGLTVSLLGVVIFVMVGILVTLVIR